MSAEELNLKSRDYCYTLNNYTQDEYEALGRISCRYHIYGKEVGENNTPHIQGYIYFVNPRAFSSMKKLMPRAHIETTQGSPQHNQTYCSKQKDFIEIGECPKQGKRTDVEIVREELAMGNGMRGVVRRATNLQQIKIAEAVLKYEEPKRDWKPHVVWYYGLTGTGKSKRAHEEFQGTDYYRKTTNTGKWWEGYDAHENVIIDDLDKNLFSYKALLDLLDRYETRIECKNGTRQFLAKRIIITASQCPQHIFGNEDQDGAELIRRIDSIIHCV